MDDAPHAEDEEVDPGHCRTGIQQRVDGPKEKEGKDVLHVIAVGPEMGNKRILLTELLCCLPSLPPPILVFSHPFQPKHTAWGAVLLDGLAVDPKGARSLLHMQAAVYHSQCRSCGMLLTLALCDWDTFAMTDDSSAVRAFK